MSKFAIRLLTLATYATALVVVPMVTPAKAETTGGRHIKKHKMKIYYRSPGFGDPWSAGKAWSAQAGWVCPGISRSFDCKSWPPPFDDDPDRRVPSLGH